MLISFCSFDVTQKICFKIFEIDIYDFLPPIINHVNFNIMVYNKLLSLALSFNFLESPDCCSLKILGD